MIAREILAVRALNHLDHIEVEALPAQWHFAPERIVPGVREAVERARARGVGSIMVAYADCGTGGLLADACGELGVAMLPGPHCFAIYGGLEESAARSDEDTATFYVTDCLARQPDAFLWKPLGLDRHPDLREAYFGHYERVAYLAQTDDARLEASARGIAARLGLPLEVRRTGYGDLGALLREGAGGTANRRDDSRSVAARGGLVAPGRDP